MAHEADPPIAPSSNPTTFDSTRGREAALKRWEKARAAPQVAADGTGTTTGQDQASGRIRAATDKALLAIVQGGESEAARVAAAKELRDRLDGRPSTVAQAQGWQPPSSPDEWAAFYAWVEEG